MILNSLRVCKYSPLSIGFMKKNNANFIYALSLYAAVSVFFMIVQFFLSGALVYLLYQLVHMAFGPDASHLFQPSLYDSVGFAFLTLTNTVLQYYLASLLAHDLKDRSALFGILTLSAALSTAFFVRLSAHSVFNSYIFASLPLIFSYLLGGVMGLVQKDEDNPFHSSKIRLFKID